MLTAAAVVLAAPDAAAFCRTTTCDPRDPSQACEIDPTTSCVLNGVPLAWPSACVSFGIQRDGSPLRSVSYETANTVISGVFTDWTSADCGGSAVPTISLADSGPITCGEAEYNQRAPNANVWMFHDDGWPYDDVSATIALTTVTYNTETGEIYDADVEVNTFNNMITVGDANVQFDLRSIAAHEAGHFLGLSHSLVPDATMLFSYRSGDISLRSLGADDMAAICAAYPPGRVARDTDCKPRHGFSRECASEDAGCECGSARGTRGATPGIAAVLVGLLALGRRVHQRMA